MAGTITVGELLSDPTSSNKITIGTGTTLDLVSGAGSVSMPSASLTGALPALDGSALTGVGKVLQVVSATGSATTTASNSYTDVVGMSVTITPSATSSRIMLMFNCGGQTQGGDVLSVKINSSEDGDITESNRWGLDTDSSYWNTAPISLIYVDSPLSTSAITYKVQAKSNSATYPWSLNVTGGTNSIRAIAMEISG